MSNPYSKILLSGDIQSSLEGIRRIDEKGSLYELNYSGNYYGVVSIPIKLLGLVKKGGCSAFITRNEEGKVITARNYDLPHLDENNQPYGVNVILRCNPKGKYKSIAGADTAWLSVLGINVRPGCYDDGTTNVTALALAPYLCMDGLNEKGLCASILALDIKAGEKAVSQNASGKKKVIITMLVRYLLDSCSDVEESIKLAESYNLINTLGCDYHLFITDAGGNAAVLEWRYNTFRVVRTNAVTNCYVGDDDAEDCYQDAGLKEKFIPLDIKPRNEYHFGYGHGYERYKTLIRNLDEYSCEGECCKSAMSNEEARRLLADVAQDYDGMLTSYTQYSVLYNNNDLTADYWLFQDYSKKYSFKL